MKQLLILGIAVALACAAQAYPSLAGPTGLASLPTAAVAPAGQLELAADWYNAEIDTIYPVRILYGIGGNIEIGALYSVLSDANTWGINAKFKAPPIATLDWAIGAQYFSNKDIDETVTQAYLVGTAPLAEASDTMPGLNGTIGANWTQDEFGTTENAFRFFVGLEAAFANKATAAVEYQSNSDKLELDAIWSVVARYPFTEAWTGEVGYSNAGLLNQPVFGDSEHNFFAGVCYAFGMAAEE